MATASQNIVPIREIRDGIVVLKDGGLRAVLLASSINLALKSQEEQEAVFAQFQAFLNSIDFPLQIIIQSRRYDPKPYLAQLETLMAEQTEPLLKTQTREYIQFIESFTEERDIMRKKFFIVVPYSPGAVERGAMKAIKEYLPFGKAKKSEEIEFAAKRTQIDQRTSIIQQGLSRVGVRTVPLGTEEIVELFYKTFNPGATGTVGLPT